LLLSRKLHTESVSRGHSTFLSSIRFDEADLLRHLSIERGVIEVSIVMTCGIHQPPIDIKVLTFVLDLDIVCRLFADDTQLRVRFHTQEVSTDVVIGMLTVVVIKSVVSLAD
jgi:hypothetical protein